MKYMKRKQIYQCSNYNCTFDPSRIEAFSYKWWKFVGVVEGKLIFNNYYYSPSTAKHQSKVLSLLNELGIKIDISMPLPNGLPGSHYKSRVYGVSDIMKRENKGLAGLIVEAEEYLCDQYLKTVLKRQEQYQKNKSRKFKKQLESYLETSVCFRDYEIKPKSQFGTYNKIAVHQVVDDIENDVQNALKNFHRDGFGSIVFYVEGL